LVKKLEKIENKFKTMKKQTAPNEVFWKSDFRIFVVEIFLKLSKNLFFP